MTSAGIRSRIVKPQQQTRHHYVRLRRQKGRPLSGRPETGRRHDTKLVTCLLAWSLSVGLPGFFVRRMPTFPGGAPLPLQLLGPVDG